MNVLANAMRNKGVQELRFLFCSYSPNSAGIREFVKQNYPALKAELPKVPILIREAPQQQPVVIARFNYGYEQGAALSDASPEAIKSTLSRLISMSQPPKP